jgi:hypothetical protein
MSAHGCITCRECSRQHCPLCSPCAVLHAHLHFDPSTGVIYYERRGKPRQAPDVHLTAASTLNPLVQLDKELRALGGTDDDAVQG